MNRETGRLLAGILTLIVGATAVVTWDACGRRWEREMAVEFQLLVGGIGLGAEPDLSRCAFGMDPRLSDQCSHVSGPIPAGNAFCACHAFSPMYVAPSVTEIRLELKERTDGETP